MEPYIAVRESDVDLAALLRPRSPGHGRRRPLRRRGPRRRDRADGPRGLRAGRPRAHRRDCPEGRRAVRPPLGRDCPPGGVARARREHPDCGRLAGHRKEAFAGAVAIIDEVKAKVPAGRRSTSGTAARPGSRGTPRAFPRASPSAPRPAGAERRPRARGGCRCSSVLPGRSRDCEPSLFCD